VTMFVLLGSGSCSRASRLLTGKILTDHFFFLMPPRLGGGGGRKEKDCYAIIPEGEHVPHHAGRSGQLHQYCVSGSPAAVRFYGQQGSQ